MQSLIYGMIICDTILIMIMFVMLAYHLSQGGEKMKGYKGFDKDLKCREFQYEIGKEFELNGEMKMCENGFHFCKELIDVTGFYNTKNGNRFCEIEATGEIIEDNKNKKCCTNKIKIIKEIPIEEVLNKVNTGYCNTGNYNTGNYNTGYCNTGYCNTGNYNTGNYNTGDRNTGYCNTGYYNTGNYNTGDCNTGNRNTGNYNTGNRNTGNYNTGNRNTGYCNTGNYNTGNYNTGDRNTGLFNTDEPNARLFNKVLNIKMRDIDIYRINNILNFINKRDVKLVWKYTEDMTVEEKEKYPEHTTTGGALMKVKVKVNVQEEWEKVSQDDKDFITSLPNFDKDIFYECTGIKV